MTKYFKHNYRIPSARAPWCNYARHATSLSINTQTAEMQENVKTFETLKTTENEKNKFMTKISLKPVSLSTIIRSYTSNSVFKFSNYHILKLAHFQINTFSNRQILKFSNFLLDFRFFLSYLRLIKKVFHQFNFYCLNIIYNRCDFSFKH
jgi:hypothetical protein